MIKVITDRDGWNKLVSNTEGTDTFYTYDFMDITKEKNDRLWLIYYKKGNDYVLYPVYLKRINENYFDIFSSEHGGPLFYIKDDQTFIKEFFIKFEELCKKNNIIAEFCRINPFNIHKEEIIKELDGQIIKETIIVDLTKDIEQGISKERKEKIKIAQKKIEIKKNNDPKLFYELYNHTINRLGATGRFVHNLEFFEKLLVKDDVTVFVAYFKEKPIAAILLLHSGNYVHTYLSCSYKDYLKYHANDILKYYSLVWAKEKGFKSYNLGGGLKKDDDLYKYKLTFSKLTTPRGIYKRIFNKEVYDELIKKNPPKDLNFFPGYRNEDDI